MLQPVLSGARRVILFCGSLSLSVFYSHFPFVLFCIHAEDKFAIGSSAKVVAVCHYEAQGNWWVCKQIKKHTSAVLSVAWHPSNVILATGCADFRCRVVSAAVRNVDKRYVLRSLCMIAPVQALISFFSLFVFLSVCSSGHDTPFGDKIGFGEVLAEFPTRGWVHDVAWSPSGKKLAFTSTHTFYVLFCELSSVWFLLRVRNDSHQHISFFFFFFCSFVPLFVWCVRCVFVYSTRLLRTVC